MNSFGQNFRYALRMMRRAPGFTAIVIATLALGIGANTAIFSVVNGVLLHDLPYGEPDRLVKMYGITPNNPRDPFSGPDYLDYKRLSHSFEYLAAYSNGSFNYAGAAEPEGFDGDHVSNEFFETLGVKPIVGRTLLGVERGQRAVVLSHALWIRRFNGTDDIIGKSLTLNGKPFTVVGVMPAGFATQTRAELWAVNGADVPDSPFGSTLKDEAGQRGARFLTVIGRLRRGTTMEAAESDLRVISKQLAAQYKEDNDKSARLVPLKDDLVGDSTRPLAILLAAVGFVLLIACANIANLLLTRSTARRREITIRTALGADRGRLIWQLLTESALLALVGGGLGLGLSVYAIEPLKALVPQSLANMHAPSIDSSVLGFTLLVSMIAGVLFGLAPALQATSIDLATMLRSGDRGVTTRSALRSVLASAQVALSLVLLIGSGLLVRSFVQLTAVDPGFDPAHVVTIGLPPSQTSGGNVPLFTAQVVERVRALPGVQAVGAAFPVPLTGSNAAGGIVIEGQAAPKAGDQKVTDLSWITPDYFRAMKIPRIGGRAFNDQDNDKAPRVVIVNQTFIKRFMGGQDPVGKRLKIADSPTDDEPWRTVVGVVGDVHPESLGAEANPQMYMPHLQEPWPYMRIVTRTVDDPAKIVPAVRREIAQLDPSLPVGDVETMQSVLDKSISQQRFRTLLLSSFALLALILAAIGIYGVISFSVAQRTREIGVRIALGARPEDVSALILRQGFAPAGTGLVIGFIAALLLAKVMRSMLYGVTVYDPMTFIVVPAILGLTAFAACWLPARRATRVDPIEALRTE